MREPRLALFLKAFCCVRILGTAFSALLAPFCFVCSLVLISVLFTPTVVIFLGFISRPACALCALHVVQQAHSIFTALLMYSKEMVGQSAQICWHLLSFISSFSLRLCNSWGILRCRHSFISSPIFIKLLVTASSFCLRKRKSCTHISLIPLSFFLRTSTKMRQNKESLYLAHL